MSEEAATSVGDRDALIAAQFKITILQAQLGGYEAACAAVTCAAQIYLDAFLHTGHTGQQLAARGRLHNAISTNVGELLLTKLAAQEAELTRLRQSYAAAEVARRHLLECNSEVERLLELLRDAVVPALALLTELEQRGFIEIERIAAMRAPIEAVLAASGKEQS